MKKRLLPVCAVVLASSMLFSSCIGSFGLSNKVLSWNQQISNKFVNELVFIGFWILPVYEISMLADMLVLNSVEFWSGSNPVVAGQKVVNGENGRYLVEWNKDGYDTHVKVQSADGGYQIVELSESGVMAYQEYALNANLALK